MHFDFVRPGGQWPPESVPNQADFERWDLLQSKSVNGDDGGSWTPTKPIIIGGVGMSLGASSLLTGGFATGPGGKFVLQSGDAVQLSPLRTRTLFVPILRCGTTVDVNSLSGVSIRDENYVVRVLGPKQAGVRFKNSPTAVFIDVPRRYIHTGARIATIALEFVITAKPATVPTAMELFPAAIGTTGTTVNFSPQPGNIPGWFHSVAHSIGDYINPSSQATNRGYYYECTGNGTSSSTTEPTWPTTIGTNFMDGTVQWTCRGRNGWLSTFGATPDSYWANGAGQVLAFDTDNTATPPANVASSVSNSYQIQITQLDPNALFTGVSFAYDTISSMAFE